MASGDLWVGNNEFGDLHTDELQVSEVISGQLWYQLLTCHAYYHTKKAQTSPDRLQSVSLLAERALIVCESACYD